MARRNKEAKARREYEALPLMKRKWYLRILWYIWHYVLDIRVFFSLSRFLAAMDEGSQIGLKARDKVKGKKKNAKKK